MSNGDIFKKVSKCAGFLSISAGGGGETFSILICSWIF